MKKKTSCLGQLVRLIGLGVIVMVVLLTLGRGDRERRTQAANVTPQPTATRNPNQDAIDIANGAFILAGGRNVQDVVITDGRDKGGDRTVMMTYISEDDLTEEIEDLFSAIGATLAGSDMDIDTVTLIAGRKNGDTLAIVSAPLSGIQDWRGGKINDLEFYQLLTGLE